MSWLAAEPSQQQCRFLWKTVELRGIDTASGWPRHRPVFVRLKTLCCYELSFSVSFKVLVSHTAVLKKSKHTVEQKTEFFPKAQLGKDVDWSWTAWLTCNPQRKTSISYQMAPKSFFQIRENKHDLRGIWMFKKQHVCTNTKAHCMSVNLWNSCGEDAKTFTSLGRFKQMYTNWTRWIWTGSLKR